MGPVVISCILIEGKIVTTFYILKSNICCLATIFLLGKI